MLSRTLRVGMPVKTILQKRERSKAFAECPCCWLEQWGPKLGARFSLNEFQRALSLSFGYLSSISVVVYIFRFVM